ncbi:hypothetical protein PG987_011412 [Apiospora arundinis]
MKTSGSKLFLLLPYLVQAALYQPNDTNSKPVKNIGVVLFPSFDVVDVFGSLEPLNLLSLQRQLNLYMIAATLDPISTAPRAMSAFNSSFGEVIVPSHTFDSVVRDPTLDLDMLLVPGGIGTRAPDLKRHDPIRRRRVPTTPVPGRALHGRRDCGACGRAGRPAGNDQQAQLECHGGLRAQDVLGGAGALGSRRTCLHGVRGDGGHRHHVRVDRTRVGRGDGGRPGAGDRV